MDAQRVDSVDPGTRVYYMKTYNRGERLLVLHRRVLIGEKTNDGLYQLLNPNGSIYAKVRGWEHVYY